MPSLLSNHCTLCLGQVDGSVQLLSCNKIRGIPYNPLVPKPYILDMSTDSSLTYQSFYNSFTPSIFCKVPRAVVFRPKEMDGWPSYSHPTQSLSRHSNDDGIPDDPSSKSTQSQGPFHSSRNGLLGPPPSNRGPPSYCGSVTGSLRQDYDLFDSSFSTLGRPVFDEVSMPHIKSSSSQAYSTLNTGRTQFPASQLCAITVQQPAPFELGPLPDPPLMLKPGSLQHRAYQRFVEPWMSTGQSEQSPEKPWDDNVERTTLSKQNEQSPETAWDDNAEWRSELATTVEQLGDNSNIITTILNHPKNAVRTAVAKTPKFKLRNQNEDSASSTRTSRPCNTCRRRKRKVCRSFDRALHVSVMYKILPILNKNGSLTV